MQQEFEIAVEQGVFVLPIGCTGFMSKKLWDLVIGDIDKYYSRQPQEFHEKFNNLGESIDNPRGVISMIIDILDLIVKE